MTIDFLNWKMKFDDKPMTIYFSVFCILLSVVLTRLFCQLANHTKLMDKPNDRSLHSKPTVRGGGLIFISLSLISLPIICFFTKTAFSQQLSLFTSIFLVALISFLDDLYRLSAKPRFFVHCFSALLIVLFMRPVQLDFVLFSFSNPFLITAFLFLAILWAINHFNFMDGLDGYCACQAIFLFAVYALLFSQHHALLYQDFCLILIYGLIGFLFFNFPPAKLFMGDIGSASLGLISIAIAIIAQQKYEVPMIYWFILNALFLFDATVTLLRRLLKKEQWSKAHRKHAYQRLKQAGFSTRFILAGQTVINAAFFVLLLAVLANKVSLIMLLVTQFIFIISLYLLIEKIAPMYQKLELQGS